MCRYAQIGDTRCRFCHFSPYIYAKYNHLLNQLSSMLDGNTSKAETNSLPDELYILEEELEVEDDFTYKLDHQHQSSDFR